jgi:CRISPR-associated protein Csm3
MDRLQAKLFITGQIELKTGLHIGGSSSALDIGGIDSNVIKLANGQPYIPGSSLKGKMRSLTGKKHGCDDLDGNILRTHPDIALVFGLPGNQTEAGFFTRLVVRDAGLDKTYFDQLKESGEFELELPFTEGKWENTIERQTGATKRGGLRQLERVPAGARFSFSLVYSIFNDTDRQNLTLVVEALRLLEDDYLGGSGSRGYGQIEFQNLTFALKTSEQYETENIAVEIDHWPNLQQDLPGLVNNLKSYVLQGGF